MIKKEESNIKEIKKMRKKKKKQLLKEKKAAKKAMIEAERAGRPDIARRIKDKFGF